MSYIPWIPPILFFVWFIGMMIYSRIDDSKKIKERERIESEKKSYEGKFSKIPENQSLRIDNKLIKKNELIETEK